MLITTSLLGIRFLEARKFLEDPNKRSRLIAILFCRPELPLMMTDIVPSLPYYHQRSGGNTAFYFGGFESDGDECCYGRDEAASVKLSKGAGPRAKVEETAGDMRHARDGYVSISGPEMRPWYFVPSSFDWFRREVERCTRWRYSGGCDMLLLNSRRPATLLDGGLPAPADLDFSSTIRLRLEQIERLVATPTVSELFEAIFQYAEKQDARDPAWGLSDHLGLGIAKVGLWEAMIGILPESVRDAVRAARNVVVEDVSLRPIV